MESWLSFSWIKDILQYIGLMYKEGTLILVGLDNAGKTTLMGRLKTDMLKQNAPTQFVTKEEFVVEQIKFACFDVGGQTEVRHIWKQYFPIVSAIVFLVDTADRERIPEARKVLEGILSNPDINVPIAVLGNKIDLPRAMSESQLRYELNLTPDLLRSRPIELFMCSVVHKQGYGEGLRWISKQI
eukprot:TRINITY_DN167_c0_g1_i1.p1 TRINITY_DN167_c0_g1~~TRINITY_DN167_c0_g1_i1.p1  ORF type:complete len:192 (+),score=27.12 TRINITY_DN167_c0_g1_i1:22-576(+)